MNLPNKLTIARIILTFVLMVLLFSEGVIVKYLAIAAFVAACLTDLFDGRIARKYKIETDFGKLMDPIADKVLILASFIAFVELKLVATWMVVIILMREVVITGLRIFASTKRVIIPASGGGKHKTISQMLAIFVILWFIAIKSTLIKYSNLWSESLEGSLMLGIFILMVITVILTLISGISYLWKNRSIFSSEKSS